MARTNSKTLLERLVTDWPAKLLSLAAAFLLFFFLNLTRLGEKYLSVPLSIALNEEYLPASQIPRSVRVTLKGEPETIGSIREDDITATLDMTAFKSEGIQRVNVRIERRGLAISADPLEVKVDPAEIVVSIEKKARKTVPVTPSFRGFPDQGYELVSYAITPPQVEVVGPAGAVARTADMPTDFIEFSGRNSDFSVTVNLLKKESLVVTEGKDSVEFRAVIQKAQPLKLVQDIPVELEGLPDTLQILEPPGKGSVRLRPRKGENGENAPVPRLFLDASDIQKPGTYTLGLQVDVSDSWIVETVEPLSVTVRIQAK